jgi:uncharacterized protein YbaR (Trm112 family)
MKKELVDILACPVCREGLELIVIEENEREVITGSLTCVRCGAVYPIEDAIPDLLPSDRRGIREAK